MELSDLDKLPGKSSAVSQTSELGIGVILPGDTIADTRVEVGDDVRHQPGILPIGLSQLSEMCDLDDETVLLIRAEVKTFLEVHAEKTLGRINDRGQEVYDEWGLLNPENLFVLLAILCRIVRYHKEQYPNENEKIRILTLGTGSGLTDMAMFRILTHYGIDFEIHTVDFRKDKDGQRQETGILVPLDKRNAGYGPLPERGIGHEIEKARRELGGLENIIQHHDDTATFLDAATNDPSMKGCFHLLIVDANHQFDGVLYDLIRGSNLLSPGAVTFLDDFGGSKLATNGGVTMAAYVYAAHSNQFGYYVSNPFEGPFVTNAAFFVDSEFTQAGQGWYSTEDLLEGFFSQPRVFYGDTRSAE